MIKKISEHIKFWRENNKVFIEPKKEPFDSAFIKTPLQAAIQVI